MPTDHPAPPARRAGLLVPLFSIPSERSWGVGEIGDIEWLARWCEAAGFRLVQLLPINEMPVHETSPYSALSAMAIDPQYLSMHAIEEFGDLGGEAALEPDLRTRLEAVRSSPTIDYAGVRWLKDTVLRRCFGRFRDVHLHGGTRRSAAFHAWLEMERWWVDDYALFRALHADQDERAWTDWPEPLRNREPEALAAARTALADEVQYRAWLQWLAADQWGTARDRAGRVALFGDLPFMVGGDSADVWARQEVFRLDASVGVPPDAFSETGQDWGLPVYRWDVLEARDFDWLRARARRNAALYDGYRIDHLVGFYRTYFRPHDGSPAAFVPADPDAQRRLGEQVLSVMREAGAELVAEDLGVVPDFVRASLQTLGVPGYRVFRWERAWDDEGQPFSDPIDYPRLSLATSGTHDTEPMVLWWEQAGADERTAVLAIPSVAARLAPEDVAAAIGDASLAHAVREALLEVLYAAGSSLVVLPVQDIFGWRERINQPATVGPHNWTFRLPWPVDRLSRQPESLALATQLAEWSARHGR